MEMRLTTKVGQAVVCDLRRAVYQHIQRLRAFAHLPGNIPQSLGALNRLKSKSAVSGAASLLQVSVRGE